MALVICPKCNQATDSNSRNLSTMGATLVGGTTGAIFGSSMGIALGPLGAIAGTIPVAIVGAGLAYFGKKKFLKCEHCGKVFSL